MIGLVWRFIKRDGQAGEWQVLLAALTIAVAAMSAVGFFSARVDRALFQEAHSILAADAVVSSDHPLPETYKATALRLNLKEAAIVSFPTMAIGASGPKLVSLKGVSANYPLRGEVTLYDDGREVTTKGMPLPGTAWVDQRLVDAQKLRIGDTLRLGELKVTVVGIVAREPDNAVYLFNFTPRVLLNIDDVAKTGLLVEGSRVRYRMLVSGADRAVDRFVEEISPQLQRGEQIESIDNARPELKAALERARQFLALTALASVALAAAAIGLAARRYAKRHLDGVAILRCIGVKRRQVALLYGLQWLVIGIAGCVLGAVLGYFAQGPLVNILAPAFTSQLPPTTLLPAFIAGGCGLVLLAGFGWPALAVLLRTPGLRALRSELETPPLSAWLVVITMAVALLALLWFQTGQIKLAAYTMTGFALMTLLGLAGGYVLILLVGQARRFLPADWRLAVSGLTRHRWLTLTQTAALALGAMALLTLTVIRGQLMDNWQNSLPPDAPNQFLINIQPEQREDVLQTLRQAGLSNVSLNPMIRGRFVAHNGRPVDIDRYEDQRARNLAEREFNLSSQADMAEDNVITEGRWFTPNGGAEWSVEDGIAKTLNIKVGDSLTFDIAGTPVSAKVTSLRKVRWDSFRTNFFVIGSPGTLDQQPTSYITAVHVPAEKGGIIQDLIRAQPNITAIDVTAVMASVKSVIDRVSSAVQYMFLFSLASGVVVLYAALAASQDERRAEIALLRTLGGRRQQVWRGLLTELMLGGAVSGLLAALGANLLAWSVSRWLLQLEWEPSLISFLWGVLGCAGLTLLFTWPWARKLLSTPPAQVLRNA